MNKEYLSTDIPVSSLTYALKGQKLLEQKGFRAWAGRDHDRIQGCGYKLTVKGDAQRAKQLLQSGGIKLARSTQPKAGEGYDRIQRGCGGGKRAEDCLEF